MHGNAENSPIDFYLPSSRAFHHGDYFAPSGRHFSDFLGYALCQGSGGNLADGTVKINLLILVKLES